MLLAAACLDAPGSEDSGTVHTCEGAVILVETLDGEEGPALADALDDRVPALACEAYGSGRLRCVPVDGSPECGFADDALDAAVRAQDDVRAALEALRPGVLEPDTTYVDTCACRHY